MPASNPLSLFVFPVVLAAGLSTAVSAQAQAPGVPPALNCRSMMGAPQFGAIQIQSPIGAPLEVAYPLEISPEQASSLVLSMASYARNAQFGLESNFALSTLQARLINDDKGRVFARVSSYANIDNPIFRYVVRAQWMDASGHTLVCFLPQTLLLDPTPPIPHSPLHFDADVMSHAPGAYPSYTAPNFTLPAAVATAKSPAPIEHHNRTDLSRISPAPSKRISHAAEKAHDRSYGASHPRATRSSPLDVSKNRGSVPVPPIIHSPSPTHPLDLLPVAPSLHPSTIEARTAGFGTVLKANSVQSQSVATPRASPPPAEVASVKATASKPEGVAPVPGSVKPGQPPVVAASDLSIEQITRLAGLKPAQTGSNAAPAPSGTVVPPQASIVTPDIQATAKPALMSPHPSNTLPPVQAVKTPVRRGYLTPLALVALLLFMGGFGWRFYKNRLSRKTGKAPVPSRPPSSLSPVEPDSMMSGLPSRFSPSQFGEDEINAVAEARIYRDHGQIDKAMTLIERHIRDLEAPETGSISTREPGMSDVLETRALYAELLGIKGRFDEFNAQSSIVLDLSKGAGPEWAHLSRLGRKIQPNNGLYNIGHHGGPPSDLNPSVLRTS